MNLRSNLMTKKISHQRKMRKHPEQGVEDEQKMPSHRKRSLQRVKVKAKAWTRKPKR